MDGTLQDTLTLPSGSPALYQPHVQKITLSFVPPPLVVGHEHRRRQKPRQAVLNMLFCGFPACVQGSINLFEVLYAST